MSVLIEVLKRITRGLADGSPEEKSRDVFIETGYICFGVTPANEEGGHGVRTCPQETHLGFRTRVENAPEELVALSVEVTKIVRLVETASR
jgi:hypothetical protein